MNIESLDYISDFCQNEFLRSPKSKKLLVFLPSVNGKDIYPYYPRKSWGVELAKNYNVLYISDPYQPLPAYREPMGSWFISPNGQSMLYALAERISILINEIEAHSVVFYGSSMGGYAALILSAMVSNSKAIAECPQLYLHKHPGSRYVCENILDHRIPVSEIEPLKFLKNGNSKSVFLVCSVFDRHYKEHILPFVDELSCCDLIKTKLISNAYIDSSYKKGHVSLNREDAFKFIDKAFFE